MKKLKTFLKQQEVNPSRSQENLSSRNPKQQLSWKGIKELQRNPKVPIGESKFASGYLAGLNRKRKLEPFLNLVVEHSQPSQVHFTKTMPRRKRMAGSTWDSAESQEFKTSTGSRQVSRPRNLIHSETETRLRVKSQLPTHTLNCSETEHFATVQSSETGLVLQNEALFEKLAKLWIEKKVPDQHMVEYSKALKGMIPQVFNHLIQKEIDAFQNGSAQVLQVMRVIDERENLIVKIAELSEDLETCERKDKLLAQLCSELTNLRQTSIKVVEHIVLWRDHLRNLIAVGSQRSKTSRRRRIQLAILTPYMTSANENYLLKMKADTLFFGKIAIGQHFNFGTTLGDPFLIQPSLAESMMVGDGRVIKLRQGRPQRMVLPLTEEDVQRAKVCEEMIMFEKQDYPPLPNFKKVRKLKLMLEHQREKHLEPLNNLEDLMERSSEPSESSFPKHEQLIINVQTPANVNLSNNAKNHSVETESQIDQKDVKRMVDAASRVSTPHLMHRLSRSHSNLQLLTEQQNRRSSFRDESKTKTQVVEHRIETKSRLSLKEFSSAAEMLAGVNTHEIFSQPTELKMNTGYNRVVDVSSKVNSRLLNGTKTMKPSPQSRQKKVNKKLSVTDQKRSIYLCSIGQKQSSPKRKNLNQVKKTTENKDCKLPPTPPELQQVEIETSTHQDFKQFSEPEFLQEKVLPTNQRDFKLLQVSEVPKMEVTFSNRQDVKMVQLLETKHIQVLPIEANYQQDAKRHQAPEVPTVEKVKNYQQDAKKYRDPEVQLTETVPNYQQDTKKLQTPEVYVVNTAPNNRQDVKMHQVPDGSRVKAAPSSQQDVKMKQVSDEMPVETTSNHRQDIKMLQVSASLIYMPSVDNKDKLTPQNRVTLAPITASNADKNTTRNKGSLILNDGQSMFSQSQLLTQDHKDMYSPPHRQTLLQLNDNKDKNAPVAVMPARHQNQAESKQKVVAIHLESNETKEDLLTSGMLQTTESAYKTQEKHSRESSRTQFLPLDSNDKAILSDGKELISDDPSLGQSEYYHLGSQHNPTMNEATSNSKPTRLASADLNQEKSRKQKNDFHRSNYTASDLQQSEKEDQIDEITDLPQNKCQVKPLVKGSKANYQANKANNQSDGGFSGTVYSKELSPQQNPFSPKQKPKNHLLFKSKLSPMNNGNKQFRKPQDRLPTPTGSFASFVPSTVSKLSTVSKMENLIKSKRHVPTLGKQPKFLAPVVAKHYNKTVVKQQKSPQFTPKTVITETTISPKRRVQITHGSINFEETPQTLPHKQDHGFVERTDETLPLQSQLVTEQSEEVHTGQSEHVVIKSENEEVLATIPEVTETHHDKQADSLDSVRLPVDLEKHQSQDQAIRRNNMEAVESVQLKAVKLSDSVKAISRDIHKQLKLEADSLDSAKVPTVKHSEKQLSRDQNKPTKMEADSLDSSQPVTVRPSESVRSVKILLPESRDSVRFPLAMQQDSLDIVVPQTHVDSVLSTAKHFPLKNVEQIKLPLLTHESSTFEEKQSDTNQDQKTVKTKKANDYDSNFEERLSDSNQDQKTLQSQKQNEKDIQTDPVLYQQLQSSSQSASQTESAQLSQKITKSPISKQPSLTPKMQLEQQRSAQLEPDYNQRQLESQAATTEYVSSKETFGTLNTEEDELMDEPYILKSPVSEGPKVKEEETIVLQINLTDRKPIAVKTEQDQENESKAFSRRRTELQITNFNQVHEPSPAQAIPGSKSKKSKRSMDSLTSTNIALELQPLMIYVEEVPQFFSLYSKRVDQVLLDSQYGSDTLFSKMQNGYERHYMKIISFRKGVKFGNGFVCFNVDHTMPGQRVFIRHLSTIKLTQLERALQTVLEFIWKNIPCDSIRFELFHVIDENNRLEVDPRFKDCLQRAGFRWKNLINDPITGRRSTIMQLDRSHELHPFMNPLGKTLQEPMVLRQSLVMGLGSQIQVKKMQSKSAIFQAPISVIACLAKEREAYGTQATQETLEEEYKSVNDDNPFKACFKSVPQLDGFDLYATQAVLEPKADIISEMLGEHELNFDLAGLTIREKVLEYCASVTSFDLRLPPFDFTEIDGIQSLRISCSSIVLAKYTRSKAKDERVVIIPTNEERLKLFLVPLTLVDDELAQRKSMISVFKKVLSNLKIVNDSKGSRGSRGEELVTVIVPSISYEQLFEVQELIGQQLVGGQTVLTAHMAVKLNLISGQQPPEGLSYINKPDYIVNKSFLFALTDTDFVESIDKLPILIARIDL